MRFSAFVICEERVVEEKGFIFVLSSKEYLVCDTGCSAWSVLLHDQMHRRSTLHALCSESGAAWRSWNNVV